MTEFSYPARIESVEGTHLVTFPDIPEAITEGATRQEAIENARDALGVALRRYVEAGRPLPPPGLHKGTVPVAPYASDAAKIAVIVAFGEAGISKTELSRRLGKKSDSDAHRILDPWHTTKLPALEAALGALGRRMTISVEAAE